MSDRFDFELRRAFQTLRRMELERAENFEDVLGDEAESHRALLQKGRGRWRWQGRWYRVALPAALAASAVAALVLRPTQEERFEAVLAEAVEQFGSGWVAPSDFLMSYPGREFYSRIPSITPLPAIGVGDGTTNPGNSDEENR